MRTTRLSNVMLACAALLGACSGNQRSGVLVADGAPVVSVMDFRSPVVLDPAPSGWRHRTFFRTAPMDIAFLAKDGRAAIRLETRASASMLYRFTDLDIGAYPQISWEWLVERPIVSALDERSGSAGDDHPARIYLKFRAADGAEHAMELIWGNVHLHAGDWKYLSSYFGLRRFPHYVVRGGNENVGKWFREKVHLGELYRKLWGDPAGAHLIEVALFCDSDNTGASSLAYFADVRVESRQGTTSSSPAP